MWFMERQHCDNYCCLHNYYTIERRVINNIFRYSYNSLTVGSYYKLSTKPNHNTVVLLAPIVYTNVYIYIII